MQRNEIANRICEQGLGKALAFRGGFVQVVVDAKHIALVRTQVVQIGLVFLWAGFLGSATPNSGFLEGASGGASGPRWLAGPGHSRGLGWP